MFMCVLSLNKPFVYKSQNFKSMLSRLLLNEIIISADVLSLFLNKDYFISLVLRDSIFNLMNASLPKSKVLFWKLSKKRNSTRYARYGHVTRARGS